MRTSFLPNYNLFSLIVELDLGLSFPLLVVELIIRLARILCISQGCFSIPILLEILVERTYLIVEHLLSDCAQDFVLNTYVAFY